MPLATRVESCGGGAVEQPRVGIALSEEFFAAPAARPRAPPRPTSRAQPPDAAVTVYLESRKRCRRRPPPATSSSSRTRPRSSRASRAPRPVDRLAAAGFTRTAVLTNPARHERRRHRPARRAQVAQVGFGGRHGGAHAPSQVYTLGDNPYGQLATATRRARRPPLPPPSRAGVAGGVRVFTRSCSRAAPPSTRGAAQRGPARPRRIEVALSPRSTAPRHTDRSGGGRLAPRRSPSTRRLLLSAGAVGTGRCARRRRRRRRAAAGRSTVECGCAARTPTQFCCAIL